MGWRILPHELDEVELEKLRGPLEELYAYKVGKKASVDLTDLTEEDQKFLDWVNRMRKLIYGD